ncbi:hypothetical protein HUJ05_003749 [Dendroctonus ponderosae]|nr:hypothetical protein HUJ05_003749 [Dendroctonus ponderosae]
MVLIFPSRMGIAISIPAGKHLNPILFLDKNAFISSLVIPGYLMALMTFFYLFRTAVLSKYLVGFQPDNRLRDKMRRKSAIQIILFSKVKLSQLKVPLSANTTSESCAVKDEQIFRPKSTIAVYTRNKLFVVYLCKTGFSNSRITFYSV